MSSARPCTVCLQLSFLVRRTPSYRAGLLPSHGMWSYLNPGPFNIKGPLSVILYLSRLRMLKYTCRRAQRHRHHGVDRFLCGDRHGGHRSDRSVLHDSHHEKCSDGCSPCLSADLFYNERLNAAVAIFQIFASQMLGYGMAGIRTAFRPFLTAAALCSLCSQSARSWCIRHSK